MDSQDIVDDVNTLLKMGVGDQYRLEHIKLAYIENKTIWESDKKYLERMKHKYIIEQRLGEKVGADENLQVEDEDVSTIHCWKCGKKNLLKANFCMSCGISLFDIETKGQDPGKSAGRKRPRKIPVKKLVLIGIPVLIMLAVGAAYNQGSFDGFVSEPPVRENIPTPPASDPVDTGNSKCGKGTVFDPASNSCVLDR